MRYTPAQMRSLCAARHSYLTTLARISTQRQCLVQQLQSAPLALGLSGVEVLDSHCAVDTITQQLQDMLAEEHCAYMLYAKQVAFEVMPTQALLSYTCLSLPWPKQEIL